MTNPQIMNLSYEAAKSLARIESELFIENNPQKAIEHARSSITSIESIIVQIEGSI